MITFPKCKRPTFKGWTQHSSFTNCNGCFTFTALVNFWRANHHSPPALLFPLVCWGILWNGNALCSKGQGRCDSCRVNARGLGRAGSASYYASGRQAEKCQGCRLLQRGGGWSLPSAPKKTVKGTTWVAGVALQWPGNFSDLNICLNNNWLMKLI